MLEETEITGVIYCVTNTTNNKQYVGQAYSYIIKKGKIVKHGIIGRFNVHIADAIKGSEACPKLYNAIRKYGKDAFKTELLEICEQCNLNTLETMWIKKLDTVKTGYNVTYGSETVSKLSHIEKMSRRISRKDKISETMKEKWISPEYSEKTIKANLMAVKKRATEGTTRTVNTGLPNNIYKTTNGYDIRIMRNGKYKITSVTSTSKSDELLLKEAVERRDLLEQQMEYNIDVFKNKVTDHNGNDLPKCISLINKSNMNGYKIVVRRGNKRIDRMFTNSELTMDEKLNIAISTLKNITDDFENEYSKVKERTKI